MYRVTLLVSERQFLVICYVHLNEKQFQLLSGNSEINSETKVLPEDGFDDEGDCCSFNCSNPCGVCMYHPIIQRIEEVYDMPIEVNEHIIHAILGWIMDYYEN